MNPASHRMNLRVAAALALVPLIASSLAAQPRTPGRKGPPCVSPFVRFSAHPDTIYWFDAAPFTIPVVVGPREAEKVINNDMQLQPVDPRRNLYYAVLQQPVAGLFNVIVQSTNCSEVRADTLVLAIAKPRLRVAAFDLQNPTAQSSNGVENWPGLHAVVGEVYDPSSEWAEAGIPQEHFQTVVSIKGSEVLNRFGTSFKNLTQEERRRLTIEPGTAPVDIVADIYWKPDDTPDPNKWVLLLSNQPDRNALLPLGKNGMRVERARP
jgi:hypothetical protein